MPGVDKWRPQPYYALGHWDGRRRGRPKGIPVFLPDKWGADRLQAPHTQRMDRTSQFGCFIFHIHQVVLVAPGNSSNFFPFA